MSSWELPCASCREMTCLWTYYNSLSAKWGELHRHFYFQYLINYSETVLNSQTTAACLEPRREAESKSKAGNRGKLGLAQFSRLCSRVEWITLAAYVNCRFQVMSCSRGNLFFMYLEINHSFSRGHIWIWKKQFSRVPASTRSEMGQQTDTLQATGG